VALLDHNATKMKFLENKIEVAFSPFGITFFKCPLISG
jgi:hypothetical protein